MVLYLEAGAPPLPPLFPFSPRRHMVRVIAETWCLRGWLLLPCSSVLDGALWDTLDSPGVSVGCESDPRFQVDFFVAPLGSCASCPVSFTRRSVLYSSVEGRTNAKWLVGHTLWFVYTRPFLYILLPLICWLQLLLSLLGVEYHLAVIFHKLISQMRCGSEQGWGWDSHSRINCNENKPVAISNKSINGAIN